MPTPTASVPSALPRCPDSPNCVSSQATDDDHRVEPFALKGTTAESFARLRQVVASLPRAKVKQDTGQYLKVEVTSLLLRFVDDLEFLFDPKRQLIDVRSASRVGYSDMGVNRKRIEKIRAEYLT